jgi:hypothetical protein
VRFRLSIFGLLSSFRYDRRSGSGRRTRAQSYIKSDTSPPWRTSSYYFADILQNVHDQLQVSNVEGRQRQSQMTKMAIAELHLVATGFAEAFLGGSSLIITSYQH